MAQESSPEAETWLNDGEKTVTFIELKGVGPRVINFASDTTYSVISGGGVFNIGEGNDMKVIIASPGREIFVPKGTPYQDSGRYLTMLATSVPPFDPSAIETL